MKKMKLFACIGALVAAVALLSGCEALPKDAATPKLAAQQIAFLAGQTDTPLTQLPTATEAATQPADPALTAEQLKANVLEHLGLTEDRISRVEFDWNDGLLEMEFYVGDVEYDVKLDPKTGAVLHVRKEAQTKPQPTQPAQPVQPTQPAMTLEQAKQMIFEKLNITQEQVIRPEYGFEDGAFELEFTAGNVEYEFKVDARTGAVTQISREVKAEQKPNQTAAITLEQAKQIVFAKLKITEDQITEKEFDFEHGRFELEFKVGNREYDFEVDAATGEIVKSDWEYDD